MGTRYMWLMGHVLPAHSLNSLFSLLCRAGSAPLLTSILACSSRPSTDCGLCLQSMFKDLSYPENYPQSFTFGYPILWWRSWVQTSFYTNSTLPYKQCQFNWSSHTIRFSFRWTVLPGTKLATTHPHVRYQGLWNARPQIAAATPIGALTFPYFQSQPKIYCCLRTRCAPPIPHVDRLVIKSQLTMQHLLLHLKAPSCYLKGHMAGCLAHSFILNPLAISRVPLAYAAWGDHVTLLDN